MLISVFNIEYDRRAHEKSLEGVLKLNAAYNGLPPLNASPLIDTRDWLSWSHVCDIGVEQLGTGLHQPQRSLWSWLGVDVTEDGDIVVADMDQNVLYRI